MLKLIDSKVFLISLFIGLFFTYITQRQRQIIFVYPNPDNFNKFQVKDKSEHCYEYTQHMVKCPDKNKLSQYPIQL